MGAICSTVKPESVIAQVGPGSALVEDVSVAGAQAPAEEATRLSTTPLLPGQLHSTTEEACVAEKDMALPLLGPSAAQSSSAPTGRNSLDQQLRPKEANPPAFLNVKRNSAPDMISSGPAQPSALPEPGPPLSDSALSDQQDSSREALLGVHEGAGSSGVQTLLSDNARAPGTEPGEQRQQHQQLAPGMRRSAGQESSSGTEDAAAEEIQPRRNRGLTVDVGPAAVRGDLGEGMIAVEPCVSPSPPTPSKMNRPATASQAPTPCPPAEASPRPLSASRVTDKEKASSTPARLSPARSNRHTASPATGLGLLDGTRPLVGTPPKSPSQLLRGLSYNNNNNQQAQPAAEVATISTQTDSELTHAAPGSRNPSAGSSSRQQQQQQQQQEPLQQLPPPEPATSFFQQPSHPPLQAQQQQQQQHHPEIHAALYDDDNWRPRWPAPKPQSQAQAASAAQSELDVLEDASAAAAGVLLNGAGGRAGRDRATTGGGASMDDFDDSASIASSTWSRDVEMDLSASLPPPAYHRRSSSNASLVAAVVGSKPHGNGGSHRSKPPAAKKNKSRKAPRGSAPLPGAHGGPGCFAGSSGAVSGGHRLATGYNASSYADGGEAAGMGHSEGGHGVLCETLDSVVEEQGLHVVEEVDTDTEGWGGLQLPVSKMPVALPSAVVAQ